MAAMFVVIHTTFDDFYFCHKILHGALLITNKSSTLRTFNMVPLEVIAAFAFDTKNWLSLLVYCQLRCLWCFWESDTASTDSVTCLFLTEMRISSRTGVSLQMISFRYSRQNHWVVLRLFVCFVKWIPCWMVTMQINNVPLTCWKLKKNQ